MTKTASAPITMSVGRDYRTGSKYEYLLYRGEDIIAREGFFATPAKARREGLKAAKPFLAE